MAIIVMISALFFGSAVAAEDEISVPFQDILVAEPGSTTEIANIEVEQRLVGETCSVAVNADNQASVHPGNNLIARSGSAEVVMIGIEDEANGKVVESQTIELGDRIVVELIMGPEGISSLGFGVSILCNQDPEVAPLLEESEAPKAKVVTDLCSQTDQSESASTCCDDGGSESASCCDGAVTESAASASSTCCDDSNTTATSADGCSKPTVLSELQEAPVAKSVAKQPTYTG